MPYLRYPMLIVVLSALVACSDDLFSVSNNKSLATLDVYKSRTCQCCEHWVQRMEDGLAEVFATVTVPTSKRRERSE